MRFHKITSISTLKDGKIAIHFWEGVTKIYDLPSGKISEDGKFLIFEDGTKIDSSKLWQAGKPIRTRFDGILSFADASSIWGLGESALRKAVARGKLKSGIDAVKYGKQWTVSSEAMFREYREPSPNNIVIE